MSENFGYSRGSSRGSGRGGGSRGSGGFGGRGGGRSYNDRSDRGHRDGGGDRGSGEKPKKENIMNLERYMNKQLRVQFNGGREVIGTLVGYDQLMNMVLDNVQEILRDDEGNEKTRELGLVVVRSTLLTEFSPVEGSRQIENPFTAAE